MAYTARNIIIDSYYLTGIVAKEFQEVSGSQLLDGKRLLNEVLAVKTLDNKLIPYYKEYTFNAVVGQEKYFIPGLIGVETFNFIKDNVRFASSKIEREYYFGGSRPGNIKGLPINWHSERAFNGSTLYMYFLPDNTYQCIVWGKFMLDSIDIEDDLSEVFDNFYITYLRYALAEVICAEYSVSLKPQVSEILRKIETSLQYVSPKDISSKKFSTLGSPVLLNYGDYNLGGGWRPLL